MEGRCSSSLLFAFLQAGNGEVASPWQGRRQEESSHVVVRVGWPQQMGRLLGQRFFPGGWTWESPSARPHPNRLIWSGGECAQGEDHGSGGTSVLTPLRSQTAWLHFTSALQSPHAPAFVKADSLCRPGLQVCQPQTRSGKQGCKWDVSGCHFEQVPSCLHSRGSESLSFWPNVLKLLQKRTL